MTVNIFFRPEEARLDNWKNLFSTEKIVLFLEILEPSSALKIRRNGMRNIHVHSLSYLV